MKFLLIPILYLLLRLIFAAGWTNRGKYANLAYWSRTTTPGTAFYMALVKSTPDQDDNLMSDLTEVAAGNGYTAGGISLSRNSTDFDVLTEDDTNDWAIVQVKDIVWTASGGDLPSDSAGATYAVITDDNGTVSSRQVYHYGSLGGARVVSVGQTLTIQNFEIKLAES